MACQSDITVEKGKGLFGVNVYNILIQVIPCYWGTNRDTERNR